MEHPATLVFRSAHETRTRETSAVVIFTVWFPGTCKASTIVVVDEVFDKISIGNSPWAWRGGEVDIREDV
jgi:hypothetical protein